MSPSARNGEPSWTTGSILLLAGSTVVVLTDAIAGTALALAKLDIMGDTHSSIDEFAKLDYGYTAMKLIAFALTPWIVSWLTLYRTVLLAAMTITLACGLAALSSDLMTVFALRIVQGASGGILLVAAQALLFQAFPIRVQPLVQAVFAIGAVAAPATIAPYLQGWLLDTASWSWIYLSVIPVGLTGIILIALAPEPCIPALPRVSLDVTGTLIFGIAAVTLVFVLTQGNRWDWFNDPKIIGATLFGMSALAVLVARQFVGQSKVKILNFEIFRNGGFAFGIVASLAAGFALLGSSYLIPAFAVSVLKMTPTAAGTLLLPSTLMFIGTLLITAFLVQIIKLPGIATVPFGILGFMLAMWMLSGSSSDSGIPDMLPAVLIRGLALGFLFLSITLLTLSTLSEAILLYGIALFSVGRQVGGLVGIAFLQTFVEDQTSANRAVLAAHILPGRYEVTNKVTTIANYLASHGLEIGAAKKAAFGILAKQVTMQSTTIAFNTAFFSIALFFMVAAPCIVVWKIVLGRILVAAKSSAEDDAPHRA